MYKSYRPDMRKGVNVMGKIFDNSGKNTENEIYDT